MNRRFRTSRLVDSAASEIAAIPSNAPKWEGHLLGVGIRRSKTDAECERRKVEQRASPAPPNEKREDRRAPSARPMRVAEASRREPAERLVAVNSASHEPLAPPNAWIDLAS